MADPNINSPRYYRLYSQLQTSGYGVINNTTGTWVNTGAKLIRIDQNSLTGGKNAPYARFPVLTGTRSEVAGTRLRKSANWAIRGVPFIPSGAAGTVPDTDHFMQNLFGQPATIVAATSATYSFLDTGYLPLTLLYFNHAFTSMTSYVYWGGGLTRVRFNFNTQFMSMDLDGFAGWQLDSTGFAAFDTIAKAGLTAFPVEPSSPTVAGQPIPGFGVGYTCTLHSQSTELKTRVLSITYDSGLTQVQDVYGSPYPIYMVGDSRRVSLELSTIDDDSAALNQLKTDCDTDGASISGIVVAGSVAGSICTFNLNNVQPNAFMMKDQGALVDFDIPTSYAHASAPGQVNDSTIALT